MNPTQSGTKAAALTLEIDPGSSATVCLRLSDRPPATHTGKIFGKSFEKIFSKRSDEADAFYAEVIPKI